MRNIDLSDLS